MSLTKRQAEYVKGKLEVRAVRRTEMGHSGYFVPEGTIGYVLADRRLYDKPVPEYLIFWPSLVGELGPDTKIQFDDSFRTGSHNIVDVEPTGKRG